LVQVYTVMVGLLNCLSHLKMDKSLFKVYHDYRRFVLKQQS
jgi:hypothetical protein